MKPVTCCVMTVAALAIAMGAMLPTTAHAESQLKPKALVRDGTTESAPNHVAIATGMTVKKTKINWNPDLNSRGTNAKYLPTWLVRLTKARKDLKALHIFRWFGDLRLSPDYGVQFIFDRDDANAKTLARMLSFPDAPDAIMWYIDRPDHPGHDHGRAFRQGAKRHSLRVQLIAYLGYNVSALI